MTLLLKTISKYIFTSSQEEFLTPNYQSYQKWIYVFHGHPIEKPSVVYEH